MLSEGQRDSRPDLAAFELLEAIDIAPPAMRDALLALASRIVEQHPDACTQADLAEVRALLKWLGLR